MALILLFNVGALTLTMISIWKVQKVLLEILLLLSLLLLLLLLLLLSSLLLLLLLLLQLPRSTSWWQFL